jgi:hypothetical protein
MAYWITAKIDHSPEAATVPTAGDAAREARAFEGRGAEDLRIIDPDGKSVTLEDLERSLRAASPGWSP